MNQFFWQSNEGIVMLCHNFVEQIMAFARDGTACIKTLKQRPDSAFESHYFENLLNNIKRLK